jgi:hypothetical protein
VGAVATRRAAEDVKTVAPFAGFMIAWAVLCVVVFATSMTRDNRKGGLPTSTSDWKVINAEIVANAEQASSKAWLIAMAVGFGITAELLVLSRSLTWLISAPFLFGGALLLYRRSATDAKSMVRSMDATTKRFWNRTRSP